MYVVSVYRGFGASRALICLLAAAIASANAKDDLRDLVQRGFELHQREQYAESLAVLQRAHGIAPTDYFVNLLIGIDLLRTGKRADAVPFLKEASQQRPAEEFPYEYLGECEAGLRNYSEAAIAYGKAVKVAPQSAEASMALVDFGLARFAAIARELRSSQKGLAAEYRLQALSHPLADASRRQLLQQAADLDADAPGIWSELAIAEIAAADAQKAEKDLERAKTKNPSDLRAWEAEALLAARQGNWPVAIAKLNAIAKRSPAALAQIASDWPAGLQPGPGLPISGAAAQLFRCVQQNPSRCQTADFLKQLAKPERVAPNSPEVLYKQQRWEALASLTPPAANQNRQWYFRGAALASIGDCRLAIPALERSLGASAESTHAMFLLSLCYAQEAGQIEKRAEQSSGDPVLVHIMRGDVLLRLQGNSEGAITEYQAALNAGPQNAQALARLAEAQLVAGQVDAARQNAESALRIDPHRQSAMQTLAEIAMQERNYATALPYLRQLIAADPADVKTRVQLGTAYAQTGSLAEAMQYLAPALKQGYPDEKGSLHYLLGTVLRRLGRTQEATQAFQAAREISDASQRTSRQEGDARP